MNAFKPLPEYVEKIAKEIVNCTFRVHKNLGPGLLESVYETCFCYELGKAGLEFQRQSSVPIVYEGQELDETLRIDVLVECKVICELKAVDTLNPIFDAQLLTYLKLTGFD